MLQLRINYALGRIGIEQTPAQIEVRCRSADMTIRQELGQIQIRREPPVVEVDMKEALGDLGMRKPDQVAWEARALALRGFRQGLDRIVAEGDRLGRIELGGRPIIELARENTTEHKELNVQALPRTRPRIRPIGGDFAYQYILGDVEIAIEPNFPEIRYYPGSIHIYLLEEPWLEMEVVGNNVDLWV